MPDTLQLDGHSRVVNTWLQRFNRCGWNDSSFQRMVGMLSRPRDFLFLSESVTTLSSLMLKGSVEILSFPEILTFGRLVED